MSSIVYWLGENLYLNITNRCSNNCYFCLRYLKNGIAGFRLKLPVEPSLYEIIHEVQDLINREDWNEVVFCGFGEPMERLDEVLEITKWVKRYHGNVVRMDTNGHGYLLNAGREVVEELKGADLDKVSVSVNAHNASLYNKICRPQFENAFENVLKFVNESRREFETEITAVAIPDVDKPEMEKLAKKLDVKLRIRQYLPSIM